MGRLWSYLEYRQGICAILHQPVILLALGFFYVFYLGKFSLQFHISTIRWECKLLHLMRNKSPNIFGPHPWLRRFQWDITYTDPSLRCIVSLRSEYHLQL